MNNLTRGICILAALCMACCESQSLTKTYAEDTLRRINESAKKGFLPTLVDKFLSEDDDLTRAAGRNEKIDEEPVAKYHQQWRQRVAKTLLANWQIISENRLKTAANPKELENPEWHRKNDEKLNKMFAALANDELNGKWEALTAEFKKIQGELANKIAGDDADESRGKLLAWQQGFYDEELFNCALKMLKPLEPDKKWLIKHKAPSQSARDAAWGTLSVDIDMQFTEYVPSGSTGRQVVSRVPTGLKVVIRPKIPSKPDLPAQWEVSVSKPNPKTIYDGTQGSAKMAAAQLSLKRIRELLTEGCGKIRALDIPD
jgi:hypothetical protein